MGAGLTYVEMVSAVAVNYENKKTLDMLARHRSESVLGAQITGGEPQAIAKAITRVGGMGFETLDLNMGCPVRKVVNAGGGSGLLRFPDLVSEILTAARSATTLPLSVKFRLGYTREAVTVKDTVRRAIEARLQQGTIHGRTRSEGYNVPVDLSGIRDGVAKARELAPNNFLVIGNGNIFSKADALRMMHETGCDGVMISRGALGNPWIFRELLSTSPLVVTLEEWRDTVLRHIDYQREAYGDTHAAAVMLRKMLLWYSRGFPATKGLRGQLSHAATLDDAAALIRNFAGRYPLTLERQHSSHDEQQSDSHAN
jgi:nifR3 family TIM-barrel protein